MNMLKKFWTDEGGVVMSAEAVMLGTVAVLGLTVGVGTIATAVNGELNELAMAFRSFDQSFAVPGFTTSVNGAYSGVGGGFVGHPVSGAGFASQGVVSRTAGSAYIQPPEEESKQMLQMQFQHDEQAADVLAGRVLQHLNDSQLQELQRLQNQESDGLPEGSL